MTKEKKPDNIVYNTETQKHDAYLKPYATNVGAPVITTTDSVAWKNRSVHILNHKIQTRFKEIKEQYEQLMQEFEDKIFCRLSHQTSVVSIHFEVSI